MAQYRRDADSDLRAGFIRETDRDKHESVLAAQEKAKQDQAPEGKAEQGQTGADKDLAENKSADGETKGKTNKPSSSRKRKAEGPKISMQGISGKAITGVVKVVKKVPAKKADDAAETKQEAPQVADTSAQVDLKETPAKTVDKVASSVQKPKAEESKTPAAPSPARTDGQEQVGTSKSDSQPTEIVAQQEPKAQTSLKADQVQDKTVTSPDQVKTVNDQVPSQGGQAAGRPAAAETKEVATATAPPKKKVLVDQGVSESSFKGPRIRPQKGSYVGKDRQAPMVDRRTGRPAGTGFRSDQGRSGFGQGRPSFGQSRGPSDRRRPIGGRDFVQDKDRDEAPRFSRSPRQKKHDPRYDGQLNTDLTDNTKDDFRKQHDKRAVGARGRKHIDYNRRREDQNRSFEQEKLRQSRRQNKEKPRRPVAKLTEVKLPESLTVRELAELLKKTTAEVIAKLMGYGVMATVNQELDYDTAEVVANDFGIKSEKIVELTEEDILFDDSEDDEADLKPRPPVVVVMGHVDHGKTSILDYIRKAKVTAGEAGGITQHIGAYTVDVGGRTITFLDTPGHEAFTTMRARGAQVTDIAILVVAADDGVMPQTVEAINHARAAKTEIIVAINKVDKPGINIDRVKQELAQHGLLSEDWGGQTTMVEVSAKTGQNMDELLDMVILTADVLELKANPDRQAKGTVIESKLDRGRGPVATILVQRGTLRVGDTVVVGSIIGNVRAMTNDRGEQVKEAGPSMPVEILGLPDVPESGEIFYQVTDEKVARSLAARRQTEEREAQLRKTKRMSLDNLFAQIEEGNVKDFNLIVKGDVQGSVEAVKQSLEKLSNDEVKIEVIHGAVGAITESDVRLAEVSDAVIIGFNVRPAAGVQDMADQLGVDLRMYRVIYDAINDIEDAMKGMLDPKFKEVILGHAQVRETFNVSGIGTIAGCYVTDGIVSRSAEVRIVRDGVVVHEGKISSLRRFKDDVREVKTGYECGIGIEKYNDLKINDQIEAFEMQEVKA